MLLDELDELDDRELEELELDELDRALLDELDDRELDELDGALLDELDDRELDELELTLLDDRELLLVPGDDDPVDEPARVAWFTPVPSPVASSALGEVGPAPQPIVAPLAVTSVAPPESRIRKSRRLVGGWVSGTGVFPWLRDLDMALLTAKCWRRRGRVAHTAPRHGTPGGRCPARDVSAHVEGTTAALRRRSTTRCGG